MSCSKISRRPFSVTVAMPLTAGSQRRRWCEPLEGRQYLSGTIDHPFVLNPTTVSENFSVNQEIAGFSDTIHDPIANYSATIDWGDGAAITNGTINAHDDLFWVAGFHQYTKPGAFSITVTIYDGPIGAAGTTTSTSVGGPLTITPVNDAPIARDESLGDMLEDSGAHAFQIAGLLANDDAGPVGESDEDAQSLVITTISNVVGGTAVIQGSSVVFTPSLNYSGNGQFTYTVQDNGLNNTTPAPLTATATADFRILESNDAPIAVGDMLSSIAEDSGQRSIDAQELIANDTPGPANEANQRLTITGVSNPVGGTVTLSGHVVRFTPAPDFNGLASFVYTVTDDGKTGANDDPRSASANAFFLVTPVNDVPRPANDDLTFTTGASPRTIAFTTLLGNDLPGPADESNQSLSVTGISNIVGGTAAMTGTAVLFTATPGFDGQASFTYTATDNGATGGLSDPRSASGIVRFDVVPLPTITSAAYLFDAAAPVITATVSANANVDVSAVSVVRDTPTPAGTTTPVSITYEVNTQTISATYTGPGAVLPNGTYHLSITPNGVLNRRGETLRSTFRYDFFVLAGDANRDRKVDASDLGILSANWQGGNKIFSQADFNYDRKVDINDLYILASNWQQTLPPATVPVSLAAIDIPVRRTPVRVANLVL